MRKLTALMVILMLVSGCTGYSSPSAPGATPVATNSVTLSNYSFSPATIKVKTGTAVTWTNKDSVTHSITGDAGAFDSGSLSPGATFRYTFASSGSFAYHCSIHPTMKGDIVAE